MAVTGKKIGMKIGVTTFTALVGWTVDEKADELDQTTSADMGYGNPDSGVIQASISLKGLASVDVAHLYAPVRAGTLITTLKLYREIDDTTEAFNFPFALVIDSSMSGEVRGRFEISASLKSRGSYTYNEPSA